MISENQGILQTLEKFQVLQTRIFFSKSPTRKTYHTPEKNPGDKLKKIQVCENQIFLRFESRPCFSEIKVQIKRPTVKLHNIQWSLNPIFSMLWNPIKAIVLTSDLVCEPIHNYFRVFQFKIRSTGQILRLLRFRGHFQSNRGKKFKVIYFLWLFIIDFSLFYFL